MANEWWRFQRERPQALTAAAYVETMPGLNRKIKRNKKNLDTTWQREAWDLYSQVGELRFVSNAIAGRMAQATLYVEKDGVRQDGDDPILALITPQMIERMGLNLYIAGDAWLAGLPDPEDADLDHEETEWIVLSSMEVKSTRGQSQVEIKERHYKRKDIYLTRIWDPHPAKWEDADSPVRSALPILRELVGLTQHVSAQIDSRLAGAGVYWIPNSILNSAKVPKASGPDQTFSENPVLNAIMTAMLLPIEDRSNASAVVPLLLGAPDDAISNIRYDTFSTPFDKATSGLREEAIRRLSLALDTPPELLLGMGQSSHWSAWAVRDDVVQTHIEPRLQLICDALTTGFYRPILEQTQPGEDPKSYVVKADTKHLIQRPNRLADASQLHAAGVISDEALREAAGYSDEDAPEVSDKAQRIALEIGKTNPQLLDNMAEIALAVENLLNGVPPEPKPELKAVPEGTEIEPAPNPVGRPKDESEVPVRDVEREPLARPRL